MLVSSNKNKVVFLSGLNDMSSFRTQKLKGTLERAGMDVVSYPFFNGDKITYKSFIKKWIKKVDIFLFVLEKNNGFFSQSELEMKKMQYEIARERVDEDENFKLFIWNIDGFELNSENDLERKFINEIRNGLVNNMIFTTTSSTIRLVDDIRSFINRTAIEKLKVNDADIFTIYNSIDEDEAEGIIELLEEVVTVEKLNLIQNSDVDYMELCMTQVEHSKLVVIFFKETADWAISFTQQIWKKIGGGSANTPILLIGAENLEINHNKVFKAPNVTSLIKKEKLIPLEIKMFFEKIS